MTTNSKILLLVLLLLIAAIVWLNPVKPVSVSKTRAMLAFSFSDVGSFQINNFISAYRFTRDGESWKIARVKNDMAASVEKKDAEFQSQYDDVPMPANTLAVVKAVTPLFGIQLHEPVATSKSELRTFEINEYSLQIVFYDRNGKELDRVYAGKEGRDLFTSYIKKRGENEVYLVDENLKALLLRNYEEWLPQAPKNPGP